jgi:hypothetical protein
MLIQKRLDIVTYLPFLSFHVLSKTVSDRCAVFTSQHTSINTSQSMLLTCRDHIQGLDRSVERLTEHENCCFGDFVGFQRPKIRTLATRSTISFIDILHALEELVV